MDVRIGVTRSTKELEVELPEETDADELHASITSALTRQVEVLWLVDRKGRKVGIPAERIAYVEIGSPDGRSIGFGA